jgi:anti-sigma-K factor RskA
MDAHERFADDVPAFAAGALDAGEARAFEAHLASCPRCQAALNEMRRVTAGLDLAIDPVEPPASLRARTLAYATAQPQSATTPSSTPAPLRGSQARPASTTGVLDRPRAKQPLPSWVPIAIAASLAVAALAGVYSWALSWQVSSLREMAATSTNEADRLRDELLGARRDAARLSHTVAVMTAPDMKRVDLAGLDSYVGSTAHAFWSPSQGLVLDVSQLPVLNLERVYQLWVIQGDRTLSGGTFTVAANGTARFSAPLPPTITNVEAVAISLEPAPGVPVRTGPIVMLGKGE